MSREDASSGGGMVTVAITLGSSMLAFGGGLWVLSLGGGNPSFNLLMGAIGVIGLVIIIASMVTGAVVLALYERTGPTDENGGPT